MGCGNGTDQDVGGTPDEGADAAKHEGIGKGHGHAGGAQIGHAADAENDGEENGDDGGVVDKGRSEANGEHHDKSGSEARELSDAGEEANDEGENATFGEAGAGEAAVPLRAAHKGEFASKRAAILRSASAYCRSLRLITWEPARGLSRTNKNKCRKMISP
jgi:hypothetical protein